MSERRIVNIIGNPSSGKDKVADYFRDKYDFAIVSPSGILKAYAVERSWRLSSRQDYREAHQLMNIEYGPDAMSQRILDTEADNICISGLRVVRHMDRLREIADAKAIALWCPLSIRFERAQNDPKERDATNIKQFWLNEMPEYFNVDPAKPATMEVMYGAEYHVDASQPLHVVREQSAAAYDLAA